MKRFFQLFMLLVVLDAIASTTLFVIQGGFGGGHGRYDRAIAILGLPWVLIPWPEAIFRSDFVWLVLLPLAINLSAVGVLMALQRRLRQVR